MEFRSSTATFDLHPEHEKSGHQRQLVRDMIVHLSPAIRPLGILPSDSHQLDSLVRHEKFIGWASSSSSAILSIDVDPRWSVLREYLFRYIMRTKKQNDTAITFSFDKYDARFGSIDALLHTTAAQWISHDPTLLELSSSELEYQRYKEVFEAYNTMDAMFMLLKLHAYGESGTNFFVLENDDDCPDMDTAFWPHVLHVMNSRERPWKFLLLRHSTRPISAWLSQWPKIQVAEQDVGIIMDSAAEGCINSTTSMYLDDTRVSQWKNCIVSCGRDVRKASLAMRFVLASSRASLPEGDDLLPQFEEQMKRDVSAIMEDILQRVSGEKRPPLDDLISLLLVAKRPLNHVELRDLSRILYRTQYASAVDFSFTDDIFNHLESNLPGVFDFTHGEVRLQHPEIRTFFLPIGDAKPKIDQLGAERTWAHICIRYIQDPSFVDISEAMSSRRKVPSQPPISSIRDNLADYAVRYWHEHMREALKRLPSEEEEALQFFQDDSVVRSLGKALHAVSNTVIEDQEIDLSPLALMACTNLKLTVKQWMKNNKDPPQVQAALTRAIKAGNLEIADVLLEHADLKEAHTAESVLLAASSLGNEEFSMFLLTTVFESCPDFQWHPRLIGRAAWLGQERLVGLMIEQKAPLYVKVLWGHGPLELSARNNHAAVVELLLAHSPGLIKRKLEDDNQTALHLAATHGYAQIIDMLIQAGADKDMKGTYRPIMMAAVYGSFSAVRALLRAGAEPEYDDRGTPWSPLSGAVRYGYNKCVEALLEDKRTNLERLSQNMTALFEAVDRGHHETCRLLLDKGAYPDNEDNAEPILVYAVAKGDFEAVKLLIEQGDPSAESRTRALLSAVQSSTNVDMVRYLVHNGADYNGKTAAGLMIHEAVSGKNVAVLDVLVEAGAKVDDVNDEGQTPLHLAYNDVAMTKRLIEIGCKTSIARPDDGFTPLHVAIEMCEWEVARTILQEGRPELELKTNSSARLAGFTPLALAVWQDHAETTRLLLEAGADPNSRTEKDGAVILQLSVDEDVVRTLLDYDPDLRLRDDKGNTPLNALVEWSSVSISVIKRLLRQGSDVNQPDKRGRTPLFKALSKTDVAITKLLLDRGADLNHVSKDEGTILHAACLRGSFEVFEFFLEKKGFTDAPYHEVGTLISAACTRPDGDEGITLQILNALRESDNWDEVKLDQVCGLFGSTLSAACFSSTENVVAWLLSNGAKTNAKDGYGRYPIHFAAYRDEPMFRMLCNAGADIEARDKTGRTVLHTAAQSGSYNLVKSILKQNKSLLTSKDDDKWIPLHYAIRGFDNHFQPRRAALDPQHQIVQLLIDELKDDDACCKTNFRVFGIEDDDWSILRFARFHGASPETRKILKKMLRKRSDGKWDKTSHETKEGSVRTYACDHCLTVCMSYCYKLVTCNRIIANTTFQFSGDQRFCISLSNV